jgi:hypothetical protein
MRWRASARSNRSVACSAMKVRRYPGQWVSDSGSDGESTVVTEGTVLLRERLD